MMTTVAVLGTGYMGAPMARNIATAGHVVRVWNRSRDKADPLAAHGITVADTPADAVHGADVVVTMLSDGPVVAEVIDRAADALPAGTLWLQMSTVGDRWTTTLAERASELDVTFIDAPVLGTKQPAESGQLTVLAAGAQDVRAVVAPLFDAVGSRTIWLDEAGQASRLKLVVNAWVIALTAALAESLALAEHLDLDPQTFLDAIDGGPVGAPYAQIKGPLMIDGDYPTSFPSRLARKDIELVLEAGFPLPLRIADAAAAHFAAAVDAGHGDADMAAIRAVVTTDDA
jgi:3-hydroxyisobutyrate dehydrogenase